MNNYVWATGTNSDNSGLMGADSFTLTKSCLQTHPPSPSVTLLQSHWSLSCPEKCQASPLVAFADAIHFM